MKELSNRLKERFCKDNKISLQVFQEPYFSSRLKLFGKYNDYKDFEEMINRDFNGDEQAYFKEYNKVKDDAINYIKESYVFNKLNSDDMNKFSSKLKFRQSDVYKEPNIGKSFISIDLQKANFSSLVIYGRKELLLDSHDSRQFFPSLDYKEFMRQFTDNEHIINSKYIRQVIFGNCNPKRQVGYEKYIMEKLLKYLFSNGLLKISELYSLCSDEIIISLDDMDTLRKNKILKEVLGYSIKREVPLDIEVFTVGRVLGTEAFLKKHVDGHVEAKCVNPVEAPFVYRALKGQEIQEEDYYFNYNGKLARLMEEVKVEIVYEK